MIHVICHPSHGISSPRGLEFLGWGVQVSFIDDVLSSLILVVDDLCVGVPCSVLLVVRCHLCIIIFVSWFLILLLL